MESPRILQEEFIGSDFEVITSKNKSDEGIKGKILDETFHSFDIVSNGNVKKLMKKNITFKVRKGSTWYIISGQDIEFRPEERIKKIK